MATKNPRRIRRGLAPKIKLEWVFVDAMKALELLTMNTHNRPENRTKTDRYVSDLRRGYWPDNPSPIMVSPDKKLLDGQHRLRAVFESEVPCWMVVAWNVPEDVQAVLDPPGQARRLHDIATLTGRPATKDTIAVLRRMVAGFSQGGFSTNRLTVHDHLDLHDTHMAAIAFALDNLPKSPAAPAAVRAVIARAFYSVDEAVLVEFCRLLSTGVCTNNYGLTVIRFRDMMLTRQSIVGSSVSSADIYRRCERALHAFVERKVLKRIFPASSELFPLPSELSYKEKVSA